MKRLFLTVVGLCLFFLFCGTASAEDGVALSYVYNRGEKVTLEDNLICENNDFFIALNSLHLINLKYKTTLKENGDFVISVFSEDAYGTENILTVSAELQKLTEVDGALNFTEHEFYDYTCSVMSKKNLHATINGIYVSEMRLKDTQPVMILNDTYYISLKTIGVALSYEYSVSDGVVNLWITDSCHAVINGYISLPDGETAESGGIDVDILLKNGKYPKNNYEDNYSVKTVNVPEGENSVYYFAETKVFSKYDKTVSVMYDFNSAYKTVNGSYNISSSSRVDVKTEAATKNEFSVDVKMPFENGIKTAKNDIYGIIVFENIGVYVSDEPLIKAGESNGKIKIDLEEGFSCAVVSVFNITGDDEIFPYGYYNKSGLSATEDNANGVSASDGKISLVLSSCKKISGKVITPLLDNDYTVKISGLGNYNEAINLYGCVDENLNFEISVPSELSSYTLFVCGKAGVYGGFVKNGESSFNGEWYEFENNKNYTDINLSYIPYLPKLPINVETNVLKGKIYLANISDCAFCDLNLYCAYYRGEKLIYGDMRKTGILKPYAEEACITVDLPQNFYKANMVKIFVWNDKMKPMSNVIEETVNKVELPERSMMIITAESKEAAFCDERITLNAAPIAKNGTMYVTEEALSCFGFSIKSDADQDEISLKYNGTYVTFAENCDSLIYAGDKSLYTLTVYAPFKKDGKLYISIEDIAKIFGFTAVWQNSNTITVNNDIADVFLTDSRFDAITSAYYNGIMLGYEDKTFKPNGNVLRSEAAIMLCRRGGYLCNLFKFTCDDVTDEHWAKSYIGICVNEGIFELEENKFRPNDNFTLEECINAMKNIACADGKSGDIEKALTENIDTNNLKRNVTRGEFAQIIYNCNKN